MATTASTASFPAHHFSNGHASNQRCDQKVCGTSWEQDDLYALLCASGESTVEWATAKAREMGDKLDHVTLNIAVIGETGAGKSGFLYPSVLKHFYIFTLRSHATLHSILCNITSFVNYMKS